MEKQQKELIGLLRSCRTTRDALDEQVDTMDPIEWTEHRKRLNKAYKILNGDDAMSRLPEARALIDDVRCDMGWFGKFGGRNK